MEIFFKPNLKTRVQEYISIQKYIKPQKRLLSKLVSLSFSVPFCCLVLLIFTFGINTNLRASDLLKITAGKVKDLKAGDEIEIREAKTKKRPAGINWVCHQVDSHAQDHPLFGSTHVGIKPKYQG